MAVLARRNPFPAISRYRDGKQFLREDFRMRCGYCALHEGEFGGWRNFHIDHFRPKSKFPELRDEYGNLLYSCSLCNIYKGSAWYDGDPLAVSPAFLDPCVHDLEAILAAAPDGAIRADLPAAQFMIEKLHLNREHLVRLRRLKATLRRIEYTAEDGIKRSRAVSEGNETAQVLESALGIVRRMAAIHLGQLESPPYGYP